MVISIWVLRVLSQAIAEEEAASPKNDADKRIIHVGFHFTMSPFLV